MKHADLKLLLKAAILLESVAALSMTSILRRSIRHDLAWIIAACVAGLRLTAACGGTLIERGVGERRWPSQQLGLSY